MRSRLVGYLLLDQWRAHVPRVDAIRRDAVGTSVEVDDLSLGSRGGQPFGQGESDPTRPTGDERAPTAQVDAASGGTKSCVHALRFLSWVRREAAADSRWCLLYRRLASHGGYGVV